MRRGGILILLLGLILIVGAAGLFLFFQAPGNNPGSGDPAALPSEPTQIPEVEIVRARVDIPANTVITDTLTLLDVVTIPQTEFDSQRNVTSVSEVEGKLIIRSFRAGENILLAALTDPGLSQQIPTAEPDRARDKAYPFVVNNLSGVADQIKPGDFVDVVATFSLTRPIARIVPNDPNAPPPEQAGPAAVVETQQLLSTKTLVQQAQVLRIVRPPVTVEPTPEGGAAPESTSGGVALDETGAVIGPGAGLEVSGAAVTPGTWTLVLAINDQEAELMEFALTASARLVLVMRGAGDTAFEPTIGATLDLLISEFGLPLPQPPPYFVIGADEQLTPAPARTPAPIRVP